MGGRYKGGSWKQKNKAREEETNESVKKTCMAGKIGGGGRR